MTSNWQNVWLRKLVLQVCSIYGDAYAFLGESFCEDEFGMVKAETGKEGIDGHIGDLAVQVKFKWFGKSDRYVTVRPDAGFDILIVCGSGSNEGVKLFGIWKRQQVDSVRNPKNNRINLKDLEKLDQFAL